MSKGRRRRTSLSVSLFPFLAVLICTLGVLIVLLVLAVKSAEEQAHEDSEEHQESREQQSTQIAQLQDQLDETEVRMELIQISRPHSLDRLNTSREYRSHLEAELRSLKEKIAELDQALDAVESSAPAVVNVEQSNQRIEELTKQILLAEKQLEEKKAAAANNAKLTYSIIPHEGSGGTYRRPIFIVCEKDSICLEPLGIRLKKDDFAPPLGPGNPLDAAVLAIREYWLKHDLDHKHGSPYPLIVIRPDGAEGYAISRRAMSSWEDEFGYELVEADKELEFGEVDPELKRLVEAAIDEAKLRQNTMLAARAMQSPITPPMIGSRNSGRGNGRGKDQRPGLTASGSQGGFVVNQAWDEMEQVGFETSNGSENAGGNQGNGDISSQLSHPASFESRMNQNKQLVSIGLSGNAASAAFASGPTSSAGEKESPGQPAPSSNHGSGNLPNGSNQGSSAGAQSSSSMNSSSGSPASSEQAASENSAPSLMYQHTNLAKSKGKDWALPSKPAGATAYLRPIRVVCTENELEIRSPLGVEKRIPVGLDVTDAIDPLVNEIWRQIESWGMPGENSYWKPELRISVAAGGELNFEKLRGLLFGSGIQIKESPR